MARQKKSDIQMMSLLQEKAALSPCTYKVSAIGLDKKGNVLGHATNSHSLNWNVLEKIAEGRDGTALHAERRLLAQYAGVLKTIIICRVGKTGKMLPIDPCKNCLKAAAKYGVKIVSTMPSKKGK